jgi:hypothetical protein
MCRYAALTALAIGLPLGLSAQVRRPDPVSGAGQSSARRASKHRTEYLASLGTTGLSRANAMEPTMITGSVGLRRQFSPEWLYLGGTLDFGSTNINGESFPYERRAEGDSSRFFAVGGRANIVSARATADILWDAGEDEKFRIGVGGNAGVYAVMPTPARGEGAGSFVAPTFGVALVGEYDITRRVAIAANLGFIQFTNFDRDKLRPSASSGEDPVFGTPFQQPSEAEKSFGGARLLIGLSYRLGVPKRRSGR